jgi:hypothetical protein
MTSLTSLTMAESDCVLPSTLLNVLRTNPADAPLPVTRGEVPVEAMLEVMRGNLLERLDQHEAALREYRSQFYTAYCFAREGATG